MASTFIHPAATKEEKNVCIDPSRRIADFSSTSRKHLPPHRPFTHTRSIPAEYLGEPEPRYQLRRVRGGEGKKGGVEWGGGFLGPALHIQPPPSLSPCRGREHWVAEARGSVSQAVPNALPPHPSTALLPSRGSSAVHRRCVKRKLSP